MSIRNRSEATLKAAVADLTSLAAGTAAFVAPADASAPFTPASVYHIVSAQVTTDWAYTYSGADSGGNPFSGNGGETTSLTLARTTNRALNRLGIYTGVLQGSFVGNYYFTGSGVTYSCPNYTINPAAVQETLQLNVVSLPGKRVEVNAGLGPGQTATATTAFSAALANLETACGQIPPQAGSGLNYTPAPNNVHTAACDGIADGCEILPAAAFHRNRVTVRIDVSQDPVIPGDSVIPQGGTGTDSFSWTITVVLRRAARGHQ